MEEALKMQADAVAQAMTSTKQQYSALVAQAVAQGHVDAIPLYAQSMQASLTLQTPLLQGRYTELVSECALEIAKWHGIHASTRVKLRNRKFREYRRRMVKHYTGKLEKLGVAKDEILRSILRRSIYIRSVLSEWSNVGDLAEEARAIRNLLVSICKMDDDIKLPLSADGCVVEHHPRWKVPSTFELTPDHDGVLATVVNDELRRSLQSVATLADKFLESIGDMSRTLAQRFSVSLLMQHMAGDTASALRDCLKLCTQHWHEDTGLSFHPDSDAARVRMIEQSVKYSSEISDLCLTSHAHPVQSALCFVAYLWTRGTSVSDGVSGTCPSGTCTSDTCVGGTVTDGVDTVSCAEAAVGALCSLRSFEPPLRAHLRVLNVRADAVVPVNAVDYVLQVASLVGSSSLLDVVERRAAEIRDFCSDRFALSQEGNGLSVMPCARSAAEERWEAAASKCVVRRHRKLTQHFTKATQAMKSLDERVRKHAAAACQRADEPALRGLAMHVLDETVQEREGSECDNCAHFNDIVSALEMLRRVDCANELEHFLLERDIAAPLINVGEACVPLCDHGLDAAVLPTLSFSRTDTMRHRLDRVDRALEQQVELLRVRVSALVSMPVAMLLRAPRVGEDLQKELETLLSIESLPESRTQLSEVFILLEEICSLRRSVPTLAKIRTVTAQACMDLLDKLELAVATVSVKRWLHEQMDESVVALLCHRVRRLLPHSLAQAAAVCALVDALVAPVRRVTLPVSGSLWLRQKQRLETMVDAVFDLVSQAARNSPGDPALRSALAGLSVADCSHIDADCSHTGPDCSHTGPIGRFVCEMQVATTRAAALSGFVSRDAVRRAEMQCAHTAGLALSNAIAVFAACLPVETLPVHADELVELVNKWSTCLLQHNREVVRETLLSRVIQQRVDELALNAHENDRHESMHEVWQKLSQFQRPDSCRESIARLATYGDTKDALIVSLWRLIGERLCKGWLADFVSLERAASMRKSSVSDLMRSSAQSLEQSILCGTLEVSQFKDALPLSRTTQLVRHWLEVPSRLLLHELHAKGLISAHGVEPLQEKRQQLRTLFGAKADALIAAASVVESSSVSSQGRKCSIFSPNN